MNKKSICVAIASLLCLGGITSCSEKEAKGNGKKKRDYDTTNNVELAAYLGQEIIYNGIHFSLDESPEEEHHFKLKVFSTNEEIESYDVVEAYICDLNGKLYRDIVISPITFTLKSNNVAYYDLGFIYVDNFRRWYGGSDDYSSVDELRIIGEDANLTFHMWNNDVINGNGKTVNDYDCTKNVVVDANINERLKFTVKNDGKITFEAFPVKKAFLKNTLCIQGVMWEKYTVDLVEVYATDLNDDNRVTLLDKPATMNFDKVSINVTYCIDDVSEEYYKLCNGYIRYHVVTNYFTAIFQTYDYYVNGKTIDDYDLSNLEEYDGDCLSYKWYKDGTTTFMYIGNNKQNDRSNCPAFGGYIDEENKLIGFKVKYAERANVDSIDIIKSYFSDENGNNIKEYTSAPVTLHIYHDGKWDNYMCQFRVPIGDNFKDYYALCKNNVYFTLVTNIGIMKMDLIDSQIKGSKQDGEFIDTPSEEYASYNNLETIDSDFRKVEFENGRVMSIERQSIFGLPYLYAFYFDNYNKYMYDQFILFDAYFTDESGNNKMQIFDKVYKRVFNNNSSSIFYCLAPEYSYFMNNDYNVVLHLHTTWGTVNFHLNDIF